MKQAATATAVYRSDIVPTLHSRQAFVVEELTTFFRVRGYWPTALELLAFARRHDGRYDVNTIRPRLTELWKRGAVEHGDKRRCRCSGKTALTWALRSKLF